MSDSDGDTKLVKAELNPRTTSYEFLGPPGTFAITFLVPSTIYALYFGCKESNQCLLPVEALSDIPTRIQLALQDPDWWKGLWDTQAARYYLAWYAFCLVAWVILPGDQVQGTTLRTGEKKTYKINATSTFLLALGLASGTVYRYGPESLSFMYDKWLGLATAAVAMSFFQAALCYAASFKKGKLLALGGNSGNPIYDFWMGRELNPFSFGTFDLKSFNELRPGLILWVLLNFSMLCEQAVRRGGLSKVTDSMWLINAFQGWYVFDAMYNEPAIFTTMDITTDGFGLMLSVGDLAWVPFVYTLQARYLVFSQVELGPLNCAAVIIVNLLGYYIFRSSNGEKNDFRNGLNPKNLTYMQTARGTKLITSGWWGRSRHPNYLGDLLMGLAWCMTTGFNTPITYFYFVYFAVLLGHRQIRDDEACENKYGEDWETYKKLVKYRIVPYLY